MKQSKKFRFAMVSHSIEVVDAVRRSMNSDTEDLHGTLVSLDDAVSTAEALLRQGHEVILCHGGTGGLIARRIGHPVVNIPTTMLEIARALIKARDLGEQIAVTSYAAPRQGFDILQRLFAVDLRQIVFNSLGELDKGVKAAVRQGVDVIVGGGVSRNMASRLDTQTVMIEPSDQSVREALSQARTMAVVRRREIEHHERLQTMLQMINDGVLFIDGAGRLAFYNPTAESMLGMDLKARQGRSIAGDLPQLELVKVLASGTEQLENIVNIDGNDVIISSMPIRVDGKVQGAVALLKEAAVIHNIDRKLRERNYRKGLFGKYTFSDFDSRHQCMRSLVAKGKKYARSEASILIAGETGTGKELLAHAIHNHSLRHKAPFVAVNCAALPETLLESELFGYAEGAFSGAKKGGRIGLFELSNQGTIFLDEIGDISPNTQVRLLRVLESKEVMRVGGDRIVPVDVRIISSTHKDLRREVDAGRFRADLFFRLAVLRLNLPPLRHRLDDLPLLMSSLLKKYRKGVACISEAMLQKLRSYHWPGNIRELNSLMESYLILLESQGSDDALFATLFEEYASPGVVPVTAGATEVTDDGDLKQQLERHRRRIIRETLLACGNKRSLAARKLGISTNTLWRALRSRDDSC